MHNRLRYKETTSQGVPPDSLDVSPPLTIMPICFSILKRTGATYFEGGEVGANWKMAGNIYYTEGSQKVVMF